MFSKNITWHAGPVRPSTSGKASTAITFKLDMAVHPALHWPKQMSLRIPPHVMTGLQVPWSFLTVTMFGVVITMFCRHGGWILMVVVTINSKSTLPVLPSLLARAPTRRLLAMKSRAKSSPILTDMI